MLRSVSGIFGHFIKLKLYVIYKSECNGKQEKEVRVGKNEFSFGINVFSNIALVRHCICDKWFDVQAVSISKMLLYEFQLSDTWIWELSSFVLKNIAKKGINFHLRLRLKLLNMILFPTSSEVLLRVPEYHNFCF